MNKSLVNGKNIGFVLGLGAFILMLISSPPGDLSVPAWRMAALTVLIAVWWMTEALPIPATSLLPIVFFPILGIMSPGATTSTYADQTIFLFMGGFFLAVTMERWNLHKRVALYTIRLVGASPSHMILGFMVATGFLSMWISNTATAVMMVPIGMAIVSQITNITREEVQNGVKGRKQESNFAKALMLGIAYAASIGGVATIIGTPPNTIMVGMIDRMYGLKISFADWMLFGVPLSIIMLMFAWFMLTKVLFRTGDLKLAGSKEIIQKDIDELGPMSKAEKLVLAVGGLMAFFWIFRGALGIPSSRMSDTTIAIGGSILLFLLPVNLKDREFLLDWKTGVKIPWGIVLLFGGGLTLASGFDKTGLAVAISSKLQSLDSVSLVIFIGIVVTLTIFMTEITSNTATATLLIPIMGSAAVAMGVHPFATIIAACVAASYAFMLPVATPPNAVVFGSGYLRIKDMAYAGLLLNLAGIVLITLFVMYVMPIVWGIDIHTLPEAVKAATIAK